VQRRVARRPLRRVADLQDVLGGVLRRHVELGHGPFLDGADLGTRRELALDGTRAEVDRTLDPLAAAYVDTHAVFDAVHRFVPLAPDVLVSLIDEDECFGVDLDAQAFEDVVQFAQRGRNGELRLKDAGVTVRLDENM